ncbi:hypothetical protein AB3N59_17435 [Leptospira sp. WS92.C1]
MKHRLRNFSFLSLGILSILFSISCKKASLPQGILDAKWREESSELVSSYCQKLATCAEKESANLKESSKNLILERLNPANCADKFRNSNAYLLALEDPEKIKTIVRDCFETVTLESCEKIRSGVFKLSESCNQLQAIQSKH